MSHDDTPRQPDDDANSDVSPSTLFLEMMRRAAQQSDEPEAPEAAADAPQGEPPAPELRVPSVLDLAPSAPDPEPEPEPEPMPEAEVEPEPEPEPPDDSSLHEVFETDEPAQPITQPEPAAARIPIYQAPPDAVIERDDERDARLQAQEIRRVRRRRERRRRRNVGILGGFFRTAFITVFAAALASTIFTWFIDPQSFTPRVVSGLQVAESTSVAIAAPLTPTALPVTPNWMRRIGVVSGHRGPENDPGAVCPDGLTEAEINFEVAQLVVRDLRERGYSVDLLDEFDPRLDAYQAAALISLHSNDCTEYEGGASAFLVARASARPAGGPDDMLAECIGKYYADATDLERRFSLTLDMTDYHTFREIHPLTPAAILEMGFMRDDRVLLTEQQDVIAQGIVEGALCFLNGENPLLQATPSPTPTVTPTGTPESAP